MQQCFHPSAKHLLYRYAVTLNFARHSFRVNAKETWYFLPIRRCALYVLFNLQWRAEGGGVNGATAPDIQGRGASKE